MDLLATVGRCRTGRAGPISLRLGSLGSPSERDKGTGLALTLRSPVTRPLHEFGWPRPAGSDEFRITSPFGWRDDPLNPGYRVFHGGLDIGNGRLGYSVVAVASGRVVVASRQPIPPWNYPAPTNRLTTWGPSYGGNVVVVRHADGLFSQYAHMAGIAVAVGQPVSSGTKMGTIGDTGSAYRQGHLHFGLRYADAWIDPEPYIRLGKPFESGDDMVFLPSAGMAGIVNRDCDIRAGTNFRSKPELGAETILGMTTKATRFRPSLQFNEGTEANGSKVWYWGPLYVDGSGYGFVFVHASRCTPLTPIEASKPTVAQAFSVIREALGL